MGRLLQRSGNATSLPYVFLPGNHEVGSQTLLLSLAIAPWISILESHIDAGTANPVSPMFDLVTSSSTAIL